MAAAEERAWREQSLRQKCEKFVSGANEQLPLIGHVMVERVGVTAGFYLTASSPPIFSPLGSGPLDHGSGGWRSMTEPALESPAWV